MADTTKQQKSNAVKDDEIIAKFRLDIQRDADAMLDQSDKANEDMRFIYVTGGMWEGWLEEEFENRARMEFDMVSDFVNRFLAEWSNSKRGVVYRPDDSKTSDKDAELLNGIFRADFRDGYGEMAVDNAVHEVAVCGYGAWKMAAAFEDEGDPENEDQRIEWRPIHNAYNTVFWDNCSGRLDKLDARRCTVLTPFSEDSFREQWEGKDPVSAYEPESRVAWSWVDGQNKKTIYVGTRYEVVRNRESIFVYENLMTGELETWEEKDHELLKEELSGDENRRFLRERKIIRQSVEKTVFSGADILEPTRRIAGRYIPIIPVYGYRGFVDNTEFYKGLVRKLKDAARLFNMHMNQLAENASSNGQDVPIFDPDQMPENIANLWADKNNAPFLLAKALRDADGNVIQHGPLAYSKASQLDASTQVSLQTVIQFIQQTTGGAPQDTLDPDASGKAINAMLKRENMNTRPILQNIATAIKWGGVVYQSMASEVYNRRSMVRTLDADGTEGKENLLKMVMDEKTGQFYESNNLRGKKFRVYPDIGPQYETEREETVETLKGIGDFIKDIPQGQTYAPIVLAMLLENMEGVGLEPLKKFNRRNMIAMGIVEPKTEEEKEFAAKLQQPQSDPNADLIAGLTEQAKAEAQKALSDARENDSRSIVNIADAKKKSAETRKIVSETDDKRAMTMVELRKKVFEEARGLPFNG